MKSHETINNTAAPNTSVNNNRANFDGIINPNKDRHGFGMVVDPKNPQPTETEQTPGWLSFENARKQAGNLREMGGTALGALKTGYGYAEEAGRTIKNGHDIALNTAGLAVEAIGEAGKEMLNITKKTYEYAFEKIKSKNGKKAVVALGILGVSIAALAAITLREPSNEDTIKPTVKIEASKDTPSKSPEMHDKKQQPPKNEFRIPLSKTTTHTGSKHSR